ncbi:MAG: hypothetical protein NZ551_04395 [Microscillaceae bacterium]|nr:hypothetical protein [Microscillaceae bacterium]MDW8460431.1 hypothetical protein [Cytophagales bacterium]
MKKYLSTFVWLCLYASISLAQTRYESYNFYANGITEYLEFETIQMPQCTYYNSANPKIVFCLF